MKRLIYVVVFALTVLCAFVGCRPDLDPAAPDCPGYVAPHVPKAPGL